jgi:hypothetical protein
MAVRLLRLWITIVTLVATASSLSSFDHKNYVLSWTRVTRDHEYYRLFTAPFALCSLDGGGAATLLIVLSELPDLERERYRHRQSALAFILVQMVILAYLFSWVTDTVDIGLKIAFALNYLRARVILSMERQIWLSDQLRVIVMGLIWASHDRDVSIGTCCQGFLIGHRSFS